MWESFHSRAYALQWKPVAEEAYASSQDENI